MNQENQEPEKKPTINPLTGRSSAALLNLLEDLEVEKEKIARQREAILNMLEDVSDAKKELNKSYEELEQLDKLKDEFTNIGAHELKTPLITLIGYLSQILNDKETKIPEDVRKKLEICYKNAQKENNLVKDILDISKLESNSMNFEWSEVNIKEAINNTVNSLKPAADKKNITLSTEIQEIPLFQGDKGKIEQVLRNLVDNSIKFTDEKGSITINASTENHAAKVSVKDTGEGLPKEELSSIFKKFYQVDSSKTRKSDGTGLGLAICKKIVEAHNGKIYCESIKGDGTIMTFYIPLNFKPPEKKPSTQKISKKNEKSIDLNI